MRNPNRGGPGGRPRLAVDLLIVFLFLAFAALFHLGRMSQPWLTEPGESDAQDIAAMIAGRTNPELFVGDMLLGDKQNFHYYLTVHFPLVQATLGAAGDYGRAYLWWMGPHVFLLLVGAYQLGLSLGMTRVPAAAMAAALYPTAAVGWSTYWGIWSDPLPRMTFSVVLCFLLTVAVRWRDRPGRWPLIFLAAGLLSWVHSVSTPPVGLGLIFGYLLLQKPERWNWPRFLLHLVLCGLTFLVALCPFAWLYLSEHDHGLVADAALVTEGMRFRFSSGFTDYVPGIRKFVSIYFYRHPIGLIAILAAISVWIAGGREERRMLAMVVGWLVGIVLGGPLLFIIDQELASMRGGVPVEIDLIRTIRFLPPLFIVLSVFGATFWWKRLTEDHGKGLRKATATGLLVVLAVFMVRLGTRSLDPAYHQHYRIPWRGLQVMLGNPPALDETLVLHGDAVAAVKDYTPRGARIFSQGVSPPALRLSALRPVVYAWKDGGSLAYANHEAFLVWYRHARVLKEAERSGDPERLAAAVLESAKALGAEYLLFDKNAVSEKALSRDLGDQLENPTWSNSRYTLLPLPGDRTPEDRQQPSSI